MLSAISYQPSAIRRESTLYIELPTVIAEGMFVSFSPFFREGKVPRVQKGNLSVIYCVKNFPPDS